MTTAASEKIDLLIYGPTKPVVDNGFSERFERHKCETLEDVERLAPDVVQRIRGIAVIDEASVAALAA